MTRLPILFLIITCSCILNAQTPQFDWVYTATNPGHCDAEAVATDHLGHVYAAGNFYDSLFIGSTVLYPSPLASACTYIVKLDTLGNFIWVQAMYGSGACYVRDIQTDSYGNLFVMGSFSGTVTAGPHSITGPSNYLSSYIAKIGSNGNILWIKKYAGSGKVEFYNMDLSSNVIGIVGVFAGTITIDSTSQAVYGQYDALILSLDTSGNLVWLENDGGAYADYAYGIEIDNQGNFYVCGSYGSFTHEAYFGPDTLMPVSGLDAFLVKYDAAGNFQWVRTGGGDWNSAFGWGDESLSVSIDVAGNIYTVGHFGDTAFFGSQYVVAPSGGVWQYVAKYDPNGNCLWLKSPSAVGTSLVQVSSRDIYCLNGDVLVSGSFHQNVIFGNDTLMRSPSGTFDGFIASLDTSGSNWSWGKSIPGTGPTGTTTNNIAADNAGNIYIAGSGSGTTLFFDAYSISPAYMDLYVARISPDIMLGHDEDKAPYGVRVYPNPAQDVIRLESATGNQISTVMIYSILGECVRSESFPAVSSAEISIADLPRGTYFLHVTDEHGEFSVRPFVKH
ncbi:MAG TPA: T9SS type A sorting domain-containing protein [Bacteroidia bacterium]|nr:T9SS type A sorting domain-containing protein [Bacteroidia bacterium]